MEIGKKSGLVIGSIVIVILIVFGILFFARRPQSSPNSNETSASSTLANATSSIGGVTVKGGGNYTVTELPDATIPTPPNYKTPLIFSSSISSDVKSALSVQFTQIQKTLASNITDFSSWIDLGTIRKIGGDYQGAAIDWHYAAKLFPKSTVPFDNLGDLYMNFIKNYSLAEANYKQSIKNDPTDTNAYESLFSLYATYGYKSPDLGVTLLTQGIAANPTSINLELMLARYYRSTGDTTDAKTAYAAAINNAQKAGDATLAAQIQQEEASF